MLDVHGTSLTQEDKELLQHPLVGGLILFSRNFESVEQVTDLNIQIRQAAKKNFLIAVDHEGGRVQRFKDGFTLIPSMGTLHQKVEKIANQNIGKKASINTHTTIETAKVLATHCGYVMAAEVQACNIDISFAPVLDVNGISEVIGDRAFDSQPEGVITLAEAFIEGMQLAGMKATGKHFPGHGSVKADSHIDLPIDHRKKTDIEAFDMLPFKQLIKANKLDALMPAHIIFPDIDSQPVGFSSYWLQTMLRQTLGFNGVIFSDDLSMEGAKSAGGFIERAEAAQQAGCDMLLLCNNRKGCIDVIDKANIGVNKVSSQRIQKLLTTSKFNYKQLKQQQQWNNSVQFVEKYSDN